jgi:hypothetical protein
MKKDIKNTIVRVLGGRGGAIRLDDSAADREHHLN